MKKAKVMTKVEEFTKASQDAISSVREMLQSLKVTNEKISEERIANDDRIKRLQSDNQSLDGLKMDNEKIISNFEALLS
jgi:hypothetical protein